MPRRPDAPNDHDKPGGRALERLDLFEAQRRPPPDDEETEPMPALCPICGLRHRPDEEHFAREDAAETAAEEEPPAAESERPSEPTNQGREEP